MSGFVIVVDKKAGPSSFDVVRDVRNIYRGEKTGHAGSLDPFATGALVLLLGKATRLSGALLNADKKYRAVAHLGKATDSMDLTGSVISEKEVPPLTEGDIVGALKSFEGIWNQIPPMFSAKKKDGVRLYELARKNIEIVREPIPVELYSLKLVEWSAPYLTFEVHCSKGTYIRALAEELGRRLGTVAHLSALRRLSSGPFLLEEAWTIDELKAEHLAALEVGYNNYVKLLTMEGFGRPNPNQNQIDRDNFGNRLPKGHVNDRHHLPY